MKLFDAACAIPWLMPEPALQALLAVATRESDPQELARQMHGRPDALAFKDGVRRDDTTSMTVRDGVAIIDITGPIYRYADFFTEASGGVTTAALAMDLQRALDDPSVRAILFSIDSPGGEATGINELSDAIYAARSRKAITAYIAGYGASAAYWLASAAAEVVVDDTALVGSIGTVFAVPDPTQRSSRTIEFVSSQSPHKRPNPTTEAGRGTLQALVDELTEVFITKVARNRNVSTDTVRAEFGQGGLLIGQAAVAAGMADRIGSFEATLADLAARTLTTPALYRPTRAASMQEDSMDWKAFWAGMFGAAKDEGATPPSATVDAPETPEAAVVDASALATELTAAQQALIAQREAAIARTSVAFADGLISASQAVPAERDALIAAYVLAAQDDAAGGTTARVDALTALTAARPAHTLTSEAIPAAQDVRVLVNPTGAGSEMSAERRQELHGYTPLGQAARRTT